MSTGTAEPPAENQASFASRLGVFVADLQLSEVPSDVQESAKLRILDMLGNIMAAQDEQGPGALRESVVEWAGKHEASLIGSGQRVPAVNAALANGTFGHAQDFDDTHHASRIHASTVAVPAALAAAEAVGASGEQTLLAVIAGLEVSVRVGMVAPGRFHERGLHATSLCGVFGAAAAAAKLHGLDAHATSRAFGIAGSFASGLREAYLGEPTDTKALHAGWAAQAGLMAAALAAKGFTGPTTVFEGRFGFFNAFVAPDDYQVETLTAELGERWYTPEIVFKLYPCGSLIHAMIDAAIEIREEEGFDPVQIAEVVCIAPPGMVSTVLEPESQKLAPQTGYHAKFSAQYAVSVALHDGIITEASYAEERVNDPELRRFLSSVRYETDPTMAWPHQYPGGVRVVMADGSVHEVRVENSPGSLERPATIVDIARKFRGNVTRRLSSAAAEEVIDRVTRLDSEPSLQRLVALCNVSAGS